MVSLIASSTCFNTEDGIGRATTRRGYHRCRERRSFNTEDGIGRATTRITMTGTPLSTVSFNTEDGIGRATTEELQCPTCTSTTFQYRRRYREGYNTVPLSPWGYWPQMSKMENLCDFPAFSSLRQQALFAFCAVTISETLTLQGFAVFGKKLENLRPF